MGKFYNGEPGLNATLFFDKVYENEVVGITPENAKTDGVAIGRFVFASDTKTAYMKVYKDEKLQYIPVAIFDIARAGLSIQKVVSLDSVENPQPAEIYQVADKYYQCVEEIRTTGDDFTGDLNWVDAWGEKPAENPYEPGKYYTKEGTDAQPLFKLCTSVDAPAATLYQPTDLRIVQDNTGLYVVGSQWDVGVSKIPEGVRLKRRAKNNGYTFVPLLFTPGGAVFNQYINYINQVLNSESDGSIKAALKEIDAIANRVGVLEPNQLVMTNELGQLQGYNLIGNDKWIQIGAPVENEDDNVNLNGNGNDDASYHVQKFPSSIVLNHAKNTANTPLELQGATLDDMVLAYAGFYVDAAGHVIPVDYDEATGTFNTADEDKRKKKLFITSGIVNNNFTGVADGDGGQYSSAAASGILTLVPDSTSGGDGATWKDFYVIADGTAKKVKIGLTNEYKSWLQGKFDSVDQAFTQKAAELDEAFEEQETALNNTMTQFQQTINQQINTINSSISLLDDEKLYSVSSDDQATIEIEGTSTISSRSFPGFPSITLTLKDYGT